MDIPESNDIPNENIIQSLDLDYLNDKKEDENDFSTKMNSLMSKLEVELNNVKKFASLKAPLNSQDIDFSRYKFNFNNQINNFDNNNNIFNNNSPEILIEDNYIELNNNKESDKINLKNENNNNVNENNLDQNKRIDKTIHSKDENSKKEEDIIKEHKFGDDEGSLKINNINELKDSNIKNSQVIFMHVQSQLKEKEEKNNEIEEKLEKFEQERIKREEELKRREEELNRREAELNRKEEERRKKEKEMKKEIEKELERKKVEEIRSEEENEKKDEDEEAQRDRLLGEELNRLKKEEREKEEEEKRENERIKRERMIKEQKEKEEEERKKKEEEKKKELERKKKEEELKQEKELKEQIKKQKIEEEEDVVKIVEVDDDDEIQELQEVSFNEEPDYKSRIKQCITKANPQNNNNNEKLKNKEDNKKDKMPNNPPNSKINESKNKNLDSNKTNSKNKELNKSNNMLNNKKKSPNKNLKDSKLKQSQVKQSMNSNNGMKKPKQQKEPEKDFQEQKPPCLSEKRFLNSKDYKKLSQEKRDEILKYINAVENFDTKNPDLDGIQGFPCISKLENNEKNLADVIPDFEEKIIKKYDEKILENKANDFLSGNNFKSNKKTDEILSDILAMPNESHMDLIKKDFEKENLKNLELTDPNDANNIEDLEERLFSGENFAPEFNCPFSKLENLQTFIYKYSVHECPKIMANAINIFNNWRMTLGDGNSFYRVIMFSLIENYIFEKNSELLKVVLNEMTSDNFIETYKLKKMEYKKCFSILSAILMLIENDMEEKAYELFLKAYNLKDQSFDMLLIVYLKKVVYNFCEEINQLLEEKQKMSEDKDLIESIKINLDEIDNLFLEPKINVFYMISSLFDINIKIFLVTGNFLEPQDQLKTIVSEDDVPFPTLIFGYFFSSYHVLYPPNYNNSVFIKTLNEDSPDIRQLTFSLKENKKCDMCYKDTKHLAFLRKKFIVCLPCLVGFISNNVLKERRTKFLEKNCFGSEYYARPIHLEDDFYLDDYEFIEIFEDKNMINELSQIIKCCSCEKVKNKNIGFTKLKCGCLYCEECFDDIMAQLTKGQMFLLECEYEKYNYQFECSCKKKYKYKDLQELYDVDDEEREAAQKRIGEYIKTVCMICFKNMITEDKVCKIKMRKDTGIPDHFMCKNCYKKCFKEEKITTSDDEEEEENETKDMDKDNENETEETKPKTKPKKKIKIKKEEEKIYCNICSTWHNYRNEGGSCACIIF